MKTFFLCAAASTLMLGGCVVAPPPLVSVQPAPVVYQPGYVVRTLPTGYRTVRYQRNVYYSSGSNYYRRHHGGYVVVTRPY